MEFFSILNETKGGRHENKKILVHYIVLFDFYFAARNNSTR